MNDASFVPDRRAGIPERLAVHMGYSEPVQLIPARLGADVRMGSTMIALPGGAQISRAALDVRAAERGWIVREIA